MRPLHFLYGGHFMKNEATSFSLWRPLHEKMRPLYLPYGGHFMKKCGHFIFLMAATSWKNEATSFSLWRPLHVFSHENLRIFFYIIKDTSYFSLNLKEIFISMIIYFYFSLFLRPLRVRALLEAFKYSLKSNLLLLILFSFIVFYLPEFKLN